MIHDSYCSSCQTLPQIIDWAHPFTTINNCNYVSPSTFSYKRQYVMPSKPSCLIFRAQLS